TAYSGFDFNLGPFGGNGGGAYLGILNNCTLRSNSAHGNDTDAGYGAPSGYGGGACNSILSNCVITVNWALVGGGAASANAPCMLNRCTLTGNTSSSMGGGVFACALNSCALSGNSANGYTFDYFGNVSGVSGGGAASSVLTNCTVTGNSAHSLFGASGGGVS